jgi:hypothetical protein
MQQKAKKSSRHLFVPSLLLCLILIAGGGFILIHKSPASKSTSNKGVNFGPPNPKDVQQAENQKVKTIENEPSTQQQPTNQTVSISGISQDPNSHDVIVQTKLTGPGWSQCTLKLTNESAPEVTLTASVLYQPDFSTCEGFSVSSSSFSTAGDWVATISVTNSDGGIGTSSPVSIKVEL